MMENFDNILEDFTNEPANDFLWSSRKIEFTNAFNQAKPISSSELKTLVYRSDELKKFIQEVIEYNKNILVDSNKRGCILMKLKMIIYLNKALIKHIF